GRILLVADPLDELGLRRGKVRERIEETADLHWGYVLHDVDQHLPVEREMERAAHPWIVERLLLVVDPGALDDALIERRGRHAGRRFGLARGHRIDDAAVV